jgi:hypothetical protein
LHEVSRPDVEATPSRDDISISSQVATGNPARQTETRSTGTRHVNVNAPQGVQRPIPKVQKDAPREFQIGQLRRRFRPKEQNDDTGTVLTFGMAPTDPDFPFDMAELQCVLHVPRGYPLERPSLRVTNPDMPRGFQINVEKGFDNLVTSSADNGRQTLLGLMNSLDRNLERFLTTEKAPTIKFVANVGSRQEAKIVEKTANLTIVPSDTTSTRDLPPKPKSAVSTVRYSPEEKLQAEKTRRDETRQLEARLGRLPLYRKSPDGLSYVVPVNPSKPDRLPDTLRAVKTVKLIVPELYPLEKSSIELQQVGGDAARAVEASFKTWVHGSPRVTLMSQINYLVNNMHLLANTTVEDKGIREQPPAAAETKTVPDIKPVPQDLQAPSTGDETLDDRPHIKIIPRPPEWSFADTGSDSDFSSDEDESEDSFSEDDEEGGAPVPERSVANPARGVALTLPGLELHGIELLEAKMLCVTVKCERCKEPTDVKNIKPTNDPSVVSPVRVESCRKCASTLSIGTTLWISLTRRSD